MDNDISVLLLNPWIIDFAAYNFWAEPLGLLYIASLLKEAGAKIDYINCLYSLNEKNPESRNNGCSKYIRRIIEKPKKLSFVKRNYAQYGISEEEFIERLHSISHPDIVLVTSIMTYWYPGVFKAIKIIKDQFNNKVPVVLGGIYTKLCYEHAKRYSNADFIFANESFYNLLKLIEKITTKSFKRIPNINNFSDYPIPMHELEPDKNFFSVLTRKGCPFVCSYCAAKVLNPYFIDREKSSILKEIRRYSKYFNTRNIALYDDALLINAENHIIPILEKLIEDGNIFSIHLPNGIHSRYITEIITNLFKNAGIETIRIGLETSKKSLQIKTGGKTTNKDYLKAVEYLRKGGYKRKNIGTYIMTGFPGQTAKDVEDTIDFVSKAGASPYLSCFSPIPKTPIWSETVKSTELPIDKDPIFQNNTVFILGNNNFSEATIKYLKDKTLEIRNK